MTHTYTEGLTPLVTKWPRALSSKHGIAGVSEIVANVEDKADVLFWEAFPHQRRESQFAAEPTGVPMQTTNAFLVWSGIGDDTALPLPDLQDIVLGRGGSSLLAPFCEDNSAINVTMNKEAEVPWISLPWADQSEGILNRLRLFGKGWSLTERQVLSQQITQQPEIHSWIERGKAPLPHSDEWLLLASNIEARMEQIAGLEANWDSYGAPPIDQGAITEAKRLVNSGMASGFFKPFIAPGSDAGVGIEWKTESGDLYVDIIPDEMTTYALTIYASNEEVDGYLDEVDFPRLLGHIRGF